MESTLFDDLVQSLQEAKAISTGKVKTSRRFDLMPTEQIPPHPSPKSKTLRASVISPNC